MTNVYKDNGYENREDYLKGLADDFGVDEAVVFGMAEILGEDEDFDGLVCELEDLFG